MAEITYEAIREIFINRRLPLQSLLTKPGPSWKVMKDRMPGGVKLVNDEHAVEVPIIAGGGHGVGAVPPQHVSPDFKKPVFPVKDWYVRLEIAGKAKDIASPSTINALLTEREEESVWHLNRMLFGDGTGKIAKVTSVATDKSYIVIEPIFCSKTLYPGAADRYFRVGMLVDTYTASGTEHDTAVKITQVDTTNHRLYGAWNNTAASDLIYLNGSKTAGELIGFEAAIDSSSVYGGVDPADAPVWKSVVRNLAGADISRKLINDFCAELNANSPGVRITHIITSPAVANVYAELMTSLLSVTKSAEKKGPVVDVGVSGWALTTPYATWGNNGVVPIIPDQFCTEGTMYFIAGDVWYHAPVREFEWSKGDTAGVFTSLLAAGNVDKYVAIGVLRSVLFTTARNASGKIIGIRV